MSFPYVDVHVFLLEYVCKTANGNTCSGVRVASGHVLDHILKHHIKHGSSVFSALFYPTPDLRGY